MCVLGWGVEWGVVFIPSVRMLCSLSGSLPISLVIITYRTNTTHERTMCCVPFPFQNVKGQSHTCRLNFCGRSGGILVGHRSKISSWVLLKLASYSNEHVLSDNNGIPTGSTFLGFFVLSCLKDGNGGLGDLVYGGRSRGGLATKNVMNDFVDRRKYPARTYKNREHAKTGFIFADKHMTVL